MFPNARGAQSGRATSPLAVGLASSLRPEGQAKEGGQAAGRESGMSLAGRVCRVEHVSFPTPTMLVVLDGGTGGTAPAGRAASPQKIGPASVGNVVEVRLRGTWAAKCRDLRVGDRMSISRFTACRASELPRWDATDPDECAHGVQATSVNDDAPLIGALEMSGKELFGLYDRGAQAKARDAVETGSPFVVLPSTLTTITITRDVSVTITADESDGSHTLVANAGSGAPGPAPTPLQMATQAATGQRERSAGNEYAELGRYYDVVHAQRARFDALAAFIDRTVGARRGPILDAGCGTGALAFYLAINGTSVFAVDSSPAMARIVAEKTRALMPTTPGAAAVRFVPGAIDAPDFSLRNVSEMGSDVVMAYPTILCLDVLQQLPSLAAIRQAMANLSLHAARGCLLLVSVLNLDHWGPRIGTVAQHTARYDSSRLGLAVTAASVPAGTVDVISRVYVGAPSNGDEGAEVVTEMTMLALHPRAERKTLTALERTVERAVSPAYFETLAEGLGWRVRDVFATLDGAPLAVDSHTPAPPSRVYVLQRDDGDE